MKLFIFLTFAFLILNCRKNPTQNSNALGIFKICYFDENESLIKMELDTILIFDKKIDVFFYQINFDLPYYLPTKFNNSTHDTLIIWDDDSKPKNINQNILFKEIYNSEGMLISFESSSCTFCSYLPYKYYIHYDNDYNLSQIMESDNFSNYYNITHDSFENLNSISEIKNDKVVKSVRLLSN